jgi:hypothetical protein
MERMKQIKKAYDNAGTFDKLWRGGYKLPKDDDHETGTSGSAVEHGEL